MKFTPWLIIICMFLPSCMRVSISDEFNTLKKRTKKDFSHTITWPNGKQKSDSNQICTTIQKGLSRDQAVAIALENNPMLLTAFETLGIAKADLVQASLFQNPQLISVFRDPRTVGLRNNIEAEATISLTDFWQVPLQKKVAQDQLEITSRSIFQTILDTIQATTSAYNHTIFAYQQEDLAQAVVAETEKLRDQIYLRQNYGFTTDLDTNLTDVLVGHAQLMLADATNQRLNSMLALQELLGINPENSQPIIFTDNLDDIFNVPDQETMLNYALEHNPRIAIARLKILQYEHLMKLEKARTIQTLDFGVGFERPAAHNERTTVGPALTLGLPIFDYNQAQKARAQFLYDQAKKQLKAEKIHTTQIIKSLYNTIQTLAKQIFIYQEKMLPSGHKALGYTIDFNEKMQIAMPIIFQTYLALLDVRKNYIKAQQEYMNAYAQLEQMVSKKLSDF